MPIYEYRCRKCGEFEITQRMNEAPLAKCPTCRSKVTKLISSSSFHLKGSGWYITDYARKDGKGKESKPKDGGAKEGGAEATGSASAAKPEGSGKKSGGDKGAAAA